MRAKRFITFPAGGAFAPPGRAGGRRLLWRRGQLERVVRRAEDRERSGRDGRRVQRELRQHPRQLEGRTLYVFTRDSGTMSECSGACAVNWPAVARDRQAHDRQRCRRVAGLDDQPVRRGRSR